MRMSLPPSGGLGASPSRRTDSSPKRSKSTAFMTGELKAASGERGTLALVACCMSLRNQCIVPRVSRDFVISCRGLKKYFPDVKAVDGLDLFVERGECFGLLGPN